VITDLTEPLPLLSCCLQKVLFFCFNELRECLVGDPVGFIVALPPLHLLRCHLVTFHVTLDLVNFTNDLVCNLPISRKLVAVGRPVLRRGFKALYECLAIDNELNLHVGGHERLNQQKSKVLGSHRGTWVMGRD
jgi:hypothetical protein